MKTKTFLALLAAAALSLGARAAEVPSPALPAVDHYVYLTFLPEPDELMQDAKANGLTVLRVDKLSDRVIVSYQYPDGHTATLGYALLSADKRSDRVSGARMEVTRREVVTTEPEVVYVDRGPYYRTRVVYSDPWYDFWAPLTIGLGIGYVSGHHWHGGGHYHGGGHGGHSGHWRR